MLAVLVSYVLQLPEPLQPSISQLSPQIQEWYSRGSMVNILDKNMFVLTQGHSHCHFSSLKTILKCLGDAQETLILIHGFPTSSFDYFDVIDELSQSYKVVVFDHIGFGLSDKPPLNYTYSLVDQADQALALWKHLGIK